MSETPEKSAVVVGATGGIGRALAERLAAEGYDLLLVGRSNAKLREVQDALGDGRSTSLVADLADESALDELAARIASNRERIDLLVHAAGMYARGASCDVPVEDVRTLWTVNALAPFVLTSALAPVLSRSQADVVFINSSIVQRAAPELSAYTASKSALRAFADTLRAELNPRGVRVLSVYPGRTATLMQRAIAAQEAHAYDPQRLIQPETIADAIMGLVELPRTVEVTDLHLRPMLKS